MSSWSLPHPAHRMPETSTIEKVLTGQLLTGIWLEDTCLFIRFSNHQIVCIHLATRIVMAGAVRPGWLKILRVLEDPHQVILEVGALYTARICARHSKDRWRIVFQGGRALADQEVWHAAYSPHFEF